MEIELISRILKLIKCIYEKMYKKKKEKENNTVTMVTVSAKLR